jgi:hypothetical protein
MNAPVFAAFAPGVCVCGRMVSAISSRYAISCVVNGAGGAAAAVSRAGVPARGQQVRAAHEGDAAEHHADALDRFAPVDR